MKIVADMRGVTSSCAIMTVISVRAEFSCTAGRSSTACVLVVLGDFANDMDKPCSLRRREPLSSDHKEEIAWPRMCHI